MRPKYLTYNRVYLDDYFGDFFFIIEHFFFYLIWLVLRFWTMSSGVFRSSIFSDIFVFWRRLDLRICLQMFSLIILRLISFKGLISPGSKWHYEFLMISNFLKIGLISYELGINLARFFGSSYNSDISNSVFEQSVSGVVWSRYSS